MLQDQKTGLSSLEREKDRNVSGWRSESSNASSPRTDEAAVAAPKKQNRGYKIPKKDLIYFVSQLSIMFETGLNLLTALDCLSRQARNPALGKLVEDIRNAISEGLPLWVAMKRHPRVFSPVCVSMVRSGEVSGNMAEVLGHLEAFLERQENIRVQVRSALSYPVFMFFMSICVLVFLLTFVFPKFEVMFADNKGSLPAPTKFFLWLSGIMCTYWYILLPAVLVLTAGAVWCWTRKEIKDHIDHCLLKVPLLSDLITRMSLSRSFHTLAIMLGGGIPILDSLNMAKEVSGNVVFNNTWGGVAHAVENGRDLSEPLQRNSYIPPSEVQMISMGDRSGKLPSVLAKLSKRYEKEIDLAVKSLIQFVEPALIVGMGFLVGMIALSLILPIFAMSRAQ